MGFFDIFSTSAKAVDTAAEVVKMGAKGIDAIWYTDEEKAENAGKSAELKLKWGGMVLDQFKAAAAESAPQTLSRRYLAWGVFALGGFFSLYALFMRTLAALWPAMHDELVAVATFALELLTTWWPVIFAAAGFYFSVAIFRARGKG